MKNKFCLFAAFFVAIIMFGSGCTMTSKLSQAGDYEHFLTADSYGFSEEGQVVILAKLKTKPAETFLTRGNPRGPSAKRFIVAEPEVVRESIQKARERAKKTHYGRSILSEGRPLQLVFFVVPPGEKGWQMFPFDNKDRDASEDLLPEEFQDIDFEMFQRDRGLEPGHWREDTNQSTLVTLHHIGLPREIKYQTMWWHYPALVFVPATLAVDLVTFPLQAGIALWQMDQAWK